MVTHIHIHIYTHTHTHIYIHTHIHIHTHTHIDMPDVIVCYGTPFDFIVFFLDIFVNN